MPAGRLTPGEFTSFVAALLLMYGPIKKLSRVNANLQQAIAASERIFELLDTHTEVRERPNAAPLPPFTGEIEFKDVSFGYEDGHGRNTLRGVSFTVRAGQMVAIVGRSGAGKTTLVNLLPRFYDVTGGAILIDGRDLRDVSLASLRAQIGMVTQETVLFDDTIAANIAYGTPGAVQEQIEAAARAANAHDFIAAQPNGYQTTIGERGQRLSGGQRQRLAIARALLKNSPLLILDEATSALDHESERLVQEALATLMLNRTSFVIAHRLSTVRRADAIIVLDRGRVVEVGPARRVDRAPERHLRAVASVAAARIEERCARHERGIRHETKVRDQAAPRLCSGHAEGRNLAMIKSMTGFASLTRDDERGTIGRDDSVGEPPVPGFADAVAAVDRRSRAAVAGAGAEASRARPRGSVGVAAAAPGRRRRIVELNEEFAQALASAIETGAQPRAGERDADGRRLAAPAAGAQHSRAPARGRRRQRHAGHGGGRGRAECDPTARRNARPRRRAPADRSRHAQSAAVGADRAHFHRREHRPRSARSPAARAGA